VRFGGVLQKFGVGVGAPVVAVPEASWGLAAVFADDDIIARI